MRRLPIPGFTILVALSCFAAAFVACGESRESALPQATSPAAPEQAPAPAAPAPAAEPSAPAAAPAPAVQPATIDFEIYKAGFVIGVSGGKGTLHFQGRSHPLSIAGVSVGATAGISKAELAGDVENLHRLADIEGTYSAPQAGLALGGGAKVTRLENSRGVVLNVRGKQMGIEVAVDLNGMQISLAR